MASSRGMVSAVAGALIFKVLLSICAVLVLQSSLVSAKNSTTKPCLSTLVFYEQQNLTADTSRRQITNSTLGGLFVLNLKLTATADFNSETVGTRFGATTGTGGSSTDFPNSAYRIIWPEKNLNGTLLISNAVDVLSPLRELIVYGGSGSFYLARGLAYASFGSANNTLGVSSTKLEVHLDYSCGNCHS